VHEGVGIGQATNVTIVQAGRTAPPPRPARLGRPISECDPFVLEVRRAITLPGQDAATPVLPLYVPRAHDARLGEVVAEVVAGAGRMVVLVGGPATGKTRACWEAIQGLPDTWWVWHPIEPGAAAAAVGEVGPHTVLACRSGGRARRADLTRRAAGAR
jgi:hypothetical protein